jgi:hypothetical protein
MKGGEHKVAAVRVDQNGASAGSHDLAIAATVKLGKVAACPVILALPAGKIRTAATSSSGR